MDAGDYKKASTCYLIGNVFNKGIAFLTVPILQEFYQRLIMALLRLIIHG